MGSIAKKGLQQYLIQLQHHPLRTKVFGAAYLGPLGHFMHKLLDKIFKGKKDSKTVAKKVLLEQLTLSPWNNLLFMVYYGLVVEGRPWVHVKAKVKKDYPAIQYTSWTGIISKSPSSIRGLTKGQVKKNKFLVINLAPSNELLIGVHHDSLIC
ncbi:hypothetical protein TIFTF001_005954 [Ficus carica]|uniref:Uncharacterized protein n=1 Tax=Ficus carica TaxID=3494 RepID=A0AA87ZGA5_FICCA|nr:hypothetical protein TIFTF001_005954 [Ficus carica]